ncbi:MAG: thiamine ABC transporter ATP-binding protein [Alphaproteobacteria bacterium]
MVEVEAVTFRFEDMAMDFTLAAQTGACLGILGPSGAGKTTLLNLIAGFETALSGRIAIDGVDVTRLPPARRPVSMLFQEHNLFAHLSVAANVGLGIDPGLRLTREDRARVADALAHVGLGGLARRLPGQLSGGERQRAALARAFVRRRPVLLLDEPFAALGPALRREMLDLVDSLRRKAGLTVLMVSHQPEDARRIAERTAFVFEGRVLAEGPTAALLDAPPVAELAAYLGRG